MVELLAKQKQFVFDTETTNIDVYSAELVGLSFAIKAHEAWYLSMPAEREACQKKLELLRPLFEDESILKIGQNLKYDISMLAEYGISVKGPIFDTMLAHYLLEPDTSPSPSKTSLAKAVSKRPCARFLWSW